MYKFSIKDEQSSQVIFLTKIICLQPILQSPNNRAGILGTAVLNQGPENELGLPLKMESCAFAPSVKKIIIKMEANHLNFLRNPFSLPIHQQFVIFFKKSKL